MRIWELMGAAAVATSLVACGGGGEDGSNSAGVVIQSLSGEFNYCDSGEKEYAIFTPLSKNNVKVEYGTKYYLENDCSGTPIAHQYLVNPLTLSAKSSLGKQIINGNNNEEFSGIIYDVQVTTPTNSTLLTGSGVYQDASGKDCIARGDLSTTCFDQSHPISQNAESATGYLGIATDVYDSASGITYGTVYFEIKKSGNVYTATKALPKNSEIIGGMSSNNTSGISETQTNYIATAVNNTYNGLHWYLPKDTTSPINENHYFIASTYSASASPITGHQSLSSSLENLTTSLSLPDPTHLNVSRILINGVIYSSNFTSRVDTTFFGDVVRIQPYATDGKTELPPHDFDYWSTPIMLNGKLSESDILKTYYDLESPKISKYFDMTKSWQAGSAYVTRKKVFPNEIIEVLDWNTKTYDSSVTPWPGNQTTIEDMFRYVTTNFDGVTWNGTKYQLSDGTITLKEGARIWIANNKNTTSSSPTETFTCIIELNSKIYFGQYLKAGTREKTTNWINSNATLDTTIRFNATAIESIRNALNL